MKFSTIFAAGLATVAAAAPLDSDVNANAANTGAFKVANFNWGCTTDCGWLFNVTIPFSSGTHRPVNQPAQCQGSRGAQKGLVKCTTTSKNQQISAYIGKTNKDGGSTLFLSYRDSYPKKNSYYIYSGNTTVYAQTGPQASKQKRNFSVKETSAIGVA